MKRKVNNQRRETFYFVSNYEIQAYKVSFSFDRFSVLRFVKLIEMYKLVETKSHSTSLLKVQKKRFN